MSRRIESPRPSPLATSRSGDRRPRRALTAVVALTIAVAGGGLAVVAFRPGDHARPAGTADTPTIEQVAFATGVDGHWEIFTVDTDGTEATPLTDLETNQFHPAWSPDGTRIAFDAQSGEGDMQIRVMDANGSNLQTLTDGPAWNYLPAWSPDGDRIAFVSNRDGNDEVYVMNAIGPPYCITELYVLNPATGEHRRRVSTESEHPPSILDGAAEPEREVERF